MWRIVLLSVCAVYGNSIENIAQICKDGYFDTSKLGCATCDASANVQRMPDAAFEFNGNPTQCKCSAGKKRMEVDHNCQSTAPQVCEEYGCEECGGNTAPSRDDSICISCDSLGLNATSKDCLCGANFKLVETDHDGVFRTSKLCIACPSNGYSDAGSYECTQCPDHNMVYDVTNGCVCNATMGLTSVGISSFGKEVCLPTQKVEAVETKYAPTVQLKFDTLEDSSKSITLDSMLYQHYYLQAGVGCYFYNDERDIKSCQTLANLCVLQHFDHEQAACELFEDIQSQGRTSDVHDIPGWSETMPFLKYDERAMATLRRQDIEMELDFETDTALDFQLATYSMEGTLLHIKPLDRQLMYCASSREANGPSYNTQWLTYGFGYQETYSCDQAQLVDAQLLFYELYFVDKGKNNALYPVPLRITNLREKNGGSPNINSNDDEQDDDILTHRFFLFDAMSSKESVNAKPKIIRYAKAITIQIRAQDERDAAIYPPVVTITYADRVQPDIVQLSFKAEYTSDTSTFWSSATALFLVSCVMCCFVVMLRYFNWQRRSTRDSSDSIASLYSILQFFLLLIALFTNATFWLTFILCCYYFIAFKIKDDIAAMLPANEDGYTEANEYYVFQVIIVLCFWLQSISIFQKIYEQSNVDIFFIDWEKPRAKLVDSDSVKTQDAPVSVWRTILIANEWNELQTVRQTNVELTLLLLVFFLLGLDLEFLATPQPVCSDLSPGKLNMYLRFANTTFWYLLICVVQILWHYLIYERYISEPSSSQFVDLCTMAKVSCLILDEKYHGYYLHCRSPYPFADGSMLEISDQLKQEEAGLMSGRGLPNGPDDLQTFELFLTAKWRKQYDHIFATLRARLGKKSFFENNRLADRNTSNKPGRTGSKLVNASRKLSLFLKAFVENHDADYRWKMLPIPSFLYTFLRIPPEMGSKRMSFFLPDCHDYFSRVLFSGIELDLILFNILTLSVLHLWSNNTIIAVLVTYFIDKTISHLRNFWGKKNVANKTLVDERFLI